MNINIKKVLYIVVFIYLLVYPYAPAQAKEIKKAESNNLITFTQKKTHITKIEKIELIKTPEEIKENPITLAGQNILSMINKDSDYITQRICEVFGSECRNALIIAKHESNFNPSAISPTNDWGLFQINCRWQGHRVGGNCETLLDMEANLAVAKQIFDEQGWNPWYTKVFLYNY